MLQRRITWPQGLNPSFRGESTRKEDGGMFRKDRGLCDSVWAVIPPGLMSLVQVERSCN